MERSLVRGGNLSEEDGMEFDPSSTSSSSSTLVHAQGADQAKERSLEADRQATQVVSAPPTPQRSPATGDVASDV